MDTITQNQQEAQGSAYSSLHPGPLTTGFYQPSTAFLSAREHIAVMDAKGGLIAITGYSWADEDAEVVEESIAVARLFAAAPELLNALEDILEAADRDLYGFEDDGCTAKAFSNAKDLIARLGVIDAN